MSTEENKAIVRRALEHFNDPGHRESYLDLYDTMVVFHGFPPGLAPGIEGVRQFYHGVWAAFPDIVIIVDDLIAEGDRVACRFSLQATHQGEFLGIPATGRPVAFGGMTVLRFVDGKCVERWNSADMLGLLQQLGAIPAPALAGG